MPNAGQQRDLPPIPAEGWREFSACRYYDARLWWDSFDGKKEGSSARSARHAKAKRICRTECLVRKECSDAFDWRHDDGIRGGHDTPPLGTTGTKANATVRDRRLAELLRDGVPLDDAVSTVQRNSRRAS